MTYSQAARAARNHFIAQHDEPEAAARLYKRFDEATAMLGRFPNLGREGRQAGTRELVLAGTPYVLIYRIEQRSLIIVHIRDNRRRA